MNYILSIIAFAVTSIILLFTSYQVAPTPNGGLREVLIGSSCMTAFISISFIFVAMFRNMEKKQDFKKLLSRLKSYKEKIILAEEDLVNYKREVQESLTKIYPDYEKDLFKGMNPSDSENLTAIMVKYPEIKFNTVLNEYTMGIKQRLACINSLKAEIIEIKEELETMSYDGWRLVKLEMPKDI